jgi:hypothetical protein
MTTKDTDHERPDKVSPFVSFVGLPFREFRGRRQ